MPERFYRDMDAAQSGDTMVVRGDVHGRVVLKAGGDRLLVTITGEPTGEDLLNCFRDGLAQNILRTEMRTLVDVTRYFGAVDWTSVFDIRHLAPWGEGGTDYARTAFLFRDTESGATIKILTAMFTTAQHRAFTDRDAAIQWLNSREP